MLESYSSEITLKENDLIMIIDVRTKDVSSYWNKELFHYEVWRSTNTFIIRYSYLCNVCMKTLKSVHRSTCVRVCVCVLITVLQRSVHPGLSFWQTAQRAGGRTEDGLWGAQKSRVVPWSNTKTGNTQTDRQEVSHESLPVKQGKKLVEPDHLLLGCHIVRMCVLTRTHSAYTKITG